MLPVVSAGGQGQRPNAKLFVAIVTLFGKWSLCLSEYGLRTHEI